MSNHEFSHKVAIVAGGSMGIGRAAAERLARGGASVVIGARREAPLQETATAITSAGGQAAAVVSDVSTDDGARHLIETAVSTYGRLDILVNSQGIQRYGNVEETSEDLWDEVMTVNLKSMYLTARAALPHLRTAGGGAIVNVASVQGLATQTNVAAYSTSKAAIIGLTRTIAVDYAPEHIRANVVLPASVDTPMLREAADLWRGEQSVEDLIGDWGSMHPVGRVGTGEDVAEMIAFLASDRATFITGAEFKVDGGMMAALGVTLPD